MRITFILFFCFVHFFPIVLAEVPDELKIKRKSNFEFEKIPVVIKNKDQVKISFTTKDYCDVTVAIEDNKGDIVRHLASGVLGPKAPKPFKINSKEQTLIWDVKNDRGRYIKDIKEFSIRVSLGLKPQYEKTLYWEPKKRVGRGGAGTIATEDPIPVATPEGVYLYDGNGVDFVKLFDHNGNYIRTTYPFPSTQLNKIKGLVWKEYPHGYKRPQKNGLNQTTFLSSGNKNNYSFQQSGAYTMSVHSSNKKDNAGNIALVKITLNRISTTGGVPNSFSGVGLSMNGPKTWLDLNPKKPYKGNVHRDTRACAYSSAFSPDGKKLYLTGYNNTSGRRKHWLPGVKVMDYDKNDIPKTFVGDFKYQSGMTTSVACDKKGRVFVSDYTGSALNVYSPNAKLLKKIPIPYPTQININPKTGEIYVFSWFMGGIIWAQHPKLKTIKKYPTANLTILKSFDNPAVVKKFSLPFIPKPKGGGLVFGSWGDACHGTQYRATVDFWADKPTIWLISKSPMGLVAWGGEGTHNFGKGWKNCAPILMQIEGDKLKTISNFYNETVKSVLKSNDKDGHQRVYVNPKTKKLYLTDKDVNVGGGEFKQLWEVDPESGMVKKIPLPIASAEDMAFDQDGYVYFRQVYGLRRVVRFSMNPWREIPWDYGIEGRDRKKGEIISGLPLPQTPKGTNWQSEGGIWISPKGHLAVWCSIKNKDPRANVLRQGPKRKSEGGKEYRPQAYPGRSSIGSIHVWDDRGKVIFMDAVPGVSMTDGIAIDNDDDIYLMSWAPRVYNGKKYFNKISGTLMKVKAGGSKWLTEGRTPLPLGSSSKPNRPHDISGYTLGPTWVEGAKWFYGGVGNSSFKIASGCICWQHSRFTLDYYSRSFAPEPDQFSVAVLDKSGNLILRIGKYGNVDDGMPLVKSGKYNPPNPRSIGGDEVALMHAAHVATMTDRRLYISDVGNGRIVQVKLGYHKSHKIKMKDILEASK